MAAKCDNVCPGHSGRKIAKTEGRARGAGYGLSTTPTKPAEATLGFSSTRKTIDILPVRRYCSGQKKRRFKIPIQLLSASRRSGAKQLDYLKITLSDVIVSSYQISAPRG